MRTSLIIALFALPFGCAHQQAGVETAQAPPPAVQPPQIVQKQEQQKEQIAQELATKQPETPATEQAPEVASKEEAPPPPQGALPSLEKSAAPNVTCGLARVHFEFDSAELTADTKATLDQMAGCLQQNERLRVRLEGNTDERGTREYNQKLGEERAQAVLGYLEKHGVSSEQLNAISFGKDKPLCLGKNEDCFSLNRRTAIRPICKL